MFCSQCGTYNDKTANMCVKCGTELGIGTDMSRAVQEEPKALVVEKVAEPVKAEVVNEPSLPTDEKSAENDSKPAEIKEYILWAIISAILFSIPFGTAAVIFSGFTNTEKKTGNIEKAMIYSEKTAFFCKLSTVIGAVKAVAGLLVLFYFTSSDFFSNLGLPF